MYLNKLSFELFVSNEEICGIWDFLKRPSFSSSLRKFLILKTISFYVATFIKTVPKVATLFLKKLFQMFLHKHGGRNLSITSFSKNSKKMDSWEYIFRSIVAHQPLLKNPCIRSSYCTFLQPSIHAKIVDAFDQNTPEIPIIFELN